MTIGSYVHISGGCVISAKAGVRFGDFSGISHGVKIYADANDETCSPIEDQTFWSDGSRCPAVSPGRPVIAGTGSVILSNTNLEVGSGVGSNSLVDRSLEAWGIYFGVPAAS